MANRAATNNGLTINGGPLPMCVQRLLSLLLAAVTGHVAAGGQLVQLRFDADVVEVEGDVSLWLDPLAIGQSLAVSYLVEYPDEPKYPDTQTWVGSNADVQVAIGERILSADRANGPELIQMLGFSDPDLFAVELIGVAIGRWGSPLYPDFRRDFGEIHEGAGIFWAATVSLSTTTSSHDDRGEVFDETYLASLDANRTFKLSFWNGEPTNEFPELVVTANVGAISVVVPEPTGLAIALAIASSTLCSRRCVASVA